MRTCTVDDCDNDKLARGYCRKHYEAWRKTGSPTGRITKRSKAKVECLAVGCNDYSHCLGYCRIHYQRFKKHGDPFVVKNIVVRRSGEGKEWHSSPVGYIVRYEPTNQNAGPNGQVYQHRHVMSQIIGRPLRKGENVHHKNGNRKDNSPENLELWVSGQPSGQRIQDVARWAIEWLLGADLETVLTLDPELRYSMGNLGHRLKGL